MAIDSSIYSRFAPQPRSALDTFEQLQGIGARQQQLQDNALMRSFGLQDRQRKLAAEEAAGQRTNALQQLLQANAGKPEEDVIGAVRGAGFVNEAAGMEKDLLDRRGKRATTAKTEGEALTQSLGTARTLWGQVQSPDQAQRLLRAQYADPVLAPILSKLGTLDQALAEMPTDPQQWPQWRDTQAMGIEAVQKAAMERDKANKPPAPPAAVAEYEYAKQQGYKGTLEQWVTSKAKAGAAGSVTLMAPIPVQQADGTVTYVQPGNKPGSQAQPVVGADGKPLVRPGESEKPLTEGQAKAVLFSSRMQAADRIMGELSRKGASTTIPGATRNSAVGDVITAVSSPEQQQLVQAKRDFVNAVLRRESGAVISPEEFANAERQYFPQIGDSRPVVEQKARNRRAAIEGMRADVPKSRQGEVDRISGGGNSDTTANDDPLGLRGK